MTQNSMRLAWAAEELERRLQTIMKDIHQKCVRYGEEPSGYMNYVKGANIAGFIKVADAMLAYGVA
jgi:glutamate dehydrogenase (NADP+)